MRDTTVTISLDGKELARVRVLGSDNPVSDVKQTLTFKAQVDDDLPVLDRRPKAAPEYPTPNTPWHKATGA